MVADRRPVFTVVCAYHNGQNTIGNLLESIKRQNMAREDIEVIIVDDCSDIEPPFNKPEFQHFFTELDITIYRTSENIGYPGPVREIGTQRANGVWLTIADQDDLYMDDVFCKVKIELEEKNIQYYYTTNFYKLETSDNTVTNMVKQLNWNHGKFYNVDNLWKKHNIHYADDMISHEDIYISSQVNCILHHLGEEFYFSDLFTYVWIKNEGSVSNTLYGIDEDNLPHEYMEKYFGDYFKCTGYCYYERYKSGYIDREFAQLMMIQVLIYGYFYMQKFMYHHKGYYVAKNFVECSKYVRVVRELFNMTNEDIYQYSCRDTCEFFENIRAQSALATGPIIPQITYRGWLEIM